MMLYRMAPPTAHQNPLTWKPFSTEPTGEQQGVDDDKEEPERDDRDGQGKQHQHRLDQHVDPGPAPTPRSALNQTANQPVAARLTGVDGAVVVARVNGIAFGGQP